MAMDTICKKAMELNIKEISITDHLDIGFTNPEYTFDKLDLDNYFLDIEKSRKKYADCISIKSGIEIGLQSHILCDASKVIKAYPFDFVIASIHLINGEDPYYPSFYSKRTKEASYEIYYRETLNIIREFSDFDVLGHLGYIKRYMPYPYHKSDDSLHMDIIEDILKTLIDKNKGIEVNTSGYKHISELPMPTPSIIKKYRELGGNIITIGSDAHEAENIGFSFDKALAAIKKAGFDHINSFSQRKAKAINI